MHVNRWRNQLTKLLERHNHRCVYCTRKVSRSRAADDPLRATRDHIVPRSQGGSNRLENLVLACKGCNEARGTMSMQGFIESSQRRMRPRLEWLAPELARIAALEPNWDGYGADPIAPATCEALRRALLDLPPARLVPGADGSLQAEWHLAEASVTLCVEPPRAGAGQTTLP